MVLLFRLSLLVVLTFLFIMAFPLLSTTTLWNFDSSNPSYSFPHTTESLTRDVQIKNIHSHNDYWRERPLLDALSYGVVSVEADIWYFPKGFKLESEERQSRDFSNEEVYVGHSLVYLKPENTLNSLYLDSIFELLKIANPTQTDSAGNAVNATFGWEEPQFNGVFFDFPEQPLYLWFDIKTNPVETYNTVKPLLKRFIDNDYLSYYDAKSKTYHSRPIILTLTGNLPIEQIKAEEVRYAFLDGSLSDFNLDADEAKLSDIAELSRVASGSLEDLIGGKEQLYKALKSSFSPSQIASIYDHISTAHKYNLKTRIWGGVNWPKFVRMLHYNSYFANGLDLLNVDDLAEAANEF